MNEKNKEYKLTLEGKGFDDRFSRTVSEKQYLRIIAIAMGKPCDNNGGDEDEVLAKGDSLNSPPVSPQEFLRSVEAKKYSEKILALAKFVLDNEKLNDFSQKDVKEYFKKANEKLPADFWREFNVVKDNVWIAESTKGRFYITSTGLDALKDKFPKGTTKSSPRKKRKARKNHE